MVKNGQILFTWDRYSKFTIKISNLIHFYLLKQTARTVGPLKQSKKIKIKNKN
jgi:hypothetical protein